MTTPTRFCGLLLLVLVSAVVSATPPVAGDELAGEAFVSWKAVIEKVSATEFNGSRVRAKLGFSGRTTDGNQIRGNGKLRFVSGPKEVFESGEQLSGSSSLRYWATVTSMMGEDLAMIGGTGILDLLPTGSVLTTEGAVEFKAALETHNGG